MRIFINVINWLSISQAVAPVGREVLFKVYFWNRTWDVVISSGFSDLALGTFYWVLRRAPSNRHARERRSERYDLDQKCAQRPAQVGPVSERRESRCGPVPQRIESTDHWRQRRQDAGQGLRRPMRVRVTFAARRCCGIGGN
jgi:hypothetical protein